MPCSGLFLPGPPDRPGAAVVLRPRALRPPALRWHGLVRHAPPDAVPDDPVEWAAYRPARFRPGDKERRGSPAPREHGRRAPERARLGRPRPALGRASRRIVPPRFTGTRPPSPKSDAIVGLSAIQRTGGGGGSRGPPTFKKDDTGDWRCQPVPGPPRLSRQDRPIGGGDRGLRAKPIAAHPAPPDGERSGRDADGPAEALLYPPRPRPRHRAIAGFRSESGGPPVSEPPAGPGGYVPTRGPPPCPCGPAPRRPRAGPRRLPRPPRA